MRTNALTDYAIEAAQVFLSNIQGPHATNKLMAIDYEISYIYFLSTLLHKKWGHMIIKVIENKIVLILSKI